MFVEVIEGGERDCDREESNFPDERKGTNALLTSSSMTRRTSLIRA